MRILGLTFAGTSTDHRAQMVSFLRDTMSVPEVRVDGIEANVFELPDGSTFAVAAPGGMGKTGRSIGFLVEDLVGAAAELRAAGVTVGQISENERDRYAHFHAPDGQLYELVERKPA